MAQPLPAPWPPPGDRPPLLRLTPSGLYCEAGDFHIDPWRPVERAVITHGHADHARPGSGGYLATRSGEGVYRQRLGEQAPLELVEYGEAVDRRGVRVSLHPAGHVLGSAQVRVEHGGEVWVVSGDYKPEADGVSTAFEPVRCDVFITEATFGLPIYRWRPTGEVMASIEAWRRSNAESGRTGVLLAYALGKAQRLLAGLSADVGPILLHGAVASLTRRYEAAGVPFPAWEPATVERAKATKGRATVIAPPSAAGSTWARKFRPMSTAMASGWMAVRGSRRRRTLDRGFVLSDHADWPGLLSCVDASGAARVGVTHGYTDELARYLAEVRGLETFVVPTHWEGEPDADAAGADDSGSGEVEAS